MLTGLASLLVCAWVATAAIPPQEIDGPWCAGVEKPFVLDISNEEVATLLVRVGADDALARELNEIVELHRARIRALAEEAAPLLRKRDIAIGEAEDGSIERAREMAARETELAPFADRQRSILRDAETGITAALPPSAIPAWELMRLDRLERQLRTCPLYFPEEAVDWTRLLRCDDEEHLPTWRSVCCAAWPSIASARLEPREQLLDRVVSQARRMQRDRLKTLAVVDDRVVISPGGEAARDQVSLAKERYAAHSAWRDAQLATLSSLEELLDPEDAALLRLHFWFAALEGHGVGTHGNAASRTWIEANRKLADERTSVESRELLTTAMTRFLHEFPDAAKSFTRALEPLIRSQIGAAISSNEERSKSERAGKAVDAAVESLTKALTSASEP
jgi:hypothetical protein